MIAVLDADAESSERHLARALDARHVETFDDPGAFERRVRRSDCAVIRCLDPNRAPDVARITGTVARSPVPVVLVTLPEAEVLRRWKEIAVEEVLWPGEVESRLAAVVDAARLKGALSRIPAMVEEWSVAFPAPLRRALETACLAKPPVRSVSGWARLSGLDRRRLWEQWRRAVDPSSGMTLKAFLGWLQLLHAAALKRSGLPWDRVAPRLNVDRQTLHRRARKLTGRTLGELPEEDPDTLFEEFRRELWGSLRKSDPGNLIPDPDDLLYRGSSVPGHC